MRGEISPMNLGTADHYQGKPLKGRDMGLKLSLVCGMGSLLILVGISEVKAQAQPKEEVIMIEEIRIRVEPELPTVVISIPRQKPTLQPLQLKRDPISLVLEKGGGEKLDLKNIPLKPVEGERGMFARERVR